MISAEKGEGVEALAEAVARVTGVAGLSAAEPLLATERQRDCAARCLACVREAEEALRMECPWTRRRFPWTAPSAPSWS